MKTEPTPTNARPTLAVHVRHERNKSDGEMAYYFEVLLGNELIYQDGQAYGSESNAAKAGEKWLNKYRKAGKAIRANMLEVKETDPSLEVEAGNDPVAEPTAPAAPVAHVAPGAKAPTKVGKRTTPGTKRDTAQRGATKAKRLSGLDVAAELIASADGPVRVGDLVETMLNKGMWTTKGKTPTATIYAAIIREISTKGTDSRFKKTDRGLFTTNTRK